MIATRSYFQALQFLLYFHYGAKFMVTAIVLINAERGQMKETAQQLIDLPQITEVFSVAGRYDLIAMVRVKTTEEVADTITDQIGSLQGITATETLIAFRTYSQHDLEHMFSLGS